MEQDISMLKSIWKATQMGCSGIDSVESETMDRALILALDAQRKEYEAIGEEARRLLRQRGYGDKKSNSMTRYVSGMAARMQVRASTEPAAKIAQLMLQGNTRGMIKSIHNIRRYDNVDPKISALSKRLLQTEQANIDQMKQFL